MSGDVHVFPLSFGQQRLWFLDRFAPGSALYVLTASVRLRGPVDVGALELAAGELVRRHEVLRTTFRVLDGQPRQVVALRADVPVRVVDVADLAEAERLAGEEARRPFDLAHGPLLRFTLLRRGDDWSVLLACVHHIVADGWSLGILTRDLSGLYGAFASRLPPALPELPVQYADYTVWQRERLGGPAGEEQLAYWREALAGHEPLELAADRPRPRLPSFRGGRVAFVLDPETSARVEALSRAEQATPFMTLLAAFAALLGGTSGQDSVLLGSPIAGRTQPELDEVIGFFVNMLVLRIDLGGDPTFRALVGRVREHALGAYAHQELPFERLVEELAPARDPARNPLVQVVFQLQSGGAEPPLRIETGTAPFDLSCNLWPGDDGFRGELEYAADLFERDTAERIAERFAGLVTAAVADPDRRVCSLPLTTRAEREQLAAWNATALRVDGDCVHALVAARAARRPTDLAVAAGVERLAYGELDRRAERLARRLRAHGAGRDVPIAVAVERSPALAIAVLAVLKAGAAYVPLDPAAPAARNALILDELRAPAVLTTERWAAGLAGRGPVLLVSDDVEPPAGAPPLEPAGPGDVAYVIHTSGSTGRPKGVQVEHRSLANLTAWHVDRYGLGAGDRSTLLAAPSFDASVWELWPALAAGASVHVVDDPSALTAAELRAWLAEQRITVTFLPTPLAETVLDGPWPEGTALRALLTGGDVLRRVPAHALPFALVNHYGPTEATVVATAARVAVPSDGAPPPIGRPIANMRAHVVNCHGQELPVGAPGELLLAGAGLARGYLGAPALTAERFVLAGGERRYRTGDRVRRRADGQLEFLGRLDRQVKLRGHRIELGEIEAALTAHPGVVAASVELEQTCEAARLVAYVVGPEAEEHALRRHLTARLPAPMVPAAFVHLDALTLTRHGKLDRARMAVAAPRRPAPEPPRTALEEQVAALWQTVLGMPEIGVHDSFFALGGHSLSATELVSRVRETFQVELALRRMFEEPTVAGIAAAIVEARAGQVEGDALAGLLDELDALGDDEVAALLREPPR